MSFHERFEEFIKQARSGGGINGNQGFQPRYPDRQFDIGSDIWIVQPNNLTWDGIADEVYGADSGYGQDLKDANNSIFGDVLWPGMKLLLPDALENPIVPTGDEDIWNTPEFGNLLNAQEEQRRAISEFRQAEIIWPEHGEELYLTFDENNNPNPTTDAAGWPMYWDPDTKQMVPFDTGIRYTMGMVKNDFIQPLTREEQIEATQRGVERFRPEALAYYAQAAETEAFRIRALEIKEEIEADPRGFDLKRIATQGLLSGVGLGGIEAALTRPIPRDSASVQTLNDEQIFIPTKSRWWESAIDAFGMGEEFFRGVFNVLTRDIGDDNREGFNTTEILAQVTTALGTTIGPGAASAWTGIRSFFANIMNRDLIPYAVDPDTLNKLTPEEVRQREQPGRAVGEIKYMSPQDYWSLELDRNFATALRWGMTAFKKDPETGLPVHMGGIYADQFESRDEYEAYIGGLYGMYPEEQDEAIIRNIATEKSEGGTRLEHKELRDNLMGQAFDHMQAGQGEVALLVMREAMEESNLAAHWYSPYFMWAQQNEPWRYEAFMEAVTIMTLQNGEELDSRVVREVRRRYEHLGTDVAMGVTFDLLNFVGAIGAVAEIPRQIGKFIDAMGNLGLAGKLKDAPSTVLKPAKTVLHFFEWITGMADNATGVMYSRKMGNLAHNVARGVDSSVSIQGVRGMDEEMELLFRGIREDPELLQGLSAHARSPLQVQNAKDLINLYDPTSEVAAMKRINPDNIGALVEDAYRFVWDQEYKRALRELKTINDPPLPTRQLEAEAARIADQISSDPVPVGRALSVFYEQAWRSSKTTNLGQQTLDDNIFVQFGKLTGTEGGIDKMKSGFKWYYGVRNELFAWWLGGRPAWTSINYQDSTIRALSTGMRMFDDMGNAHAVNIERLLARNLQRAEFTSTMVLALKGSDDADLLIEPTIHKALRGQKFKWGPLSHVLDKRRDEIILRMAMRDAMGVPKNQVAAVTRFISDQTSIMKNSLIKGNVALNEVTEHGLRQKTFAKLFDDAFEPMDAHSLEVMVEKATEMGADEATIGVLRKLWLMGGDDAEKLSTLLTVRNTQGRAGTRPVAFSELLPDNFEEVLHRLMVDRRLRTLVFRPIMEANEASLLRHGGDGPSAADDVAETMADAIRGVNDEFTTHADDFVPQPTRIDDAADPVTDGARAAAVSDEGAEVIDLGAEGEAVLRVETTYLETEGGIINPLSDEYYAMGELQKEGMARLFDEIRPLTEAITAGKGEGNELAQAALDVAHLTEVANNTRLYRDRTHNFLVEVFPGPKRLPRGPARDAAWDVYQSLMTKAYESVITYTDEAIMAFRSGAAETGTVAREMPSLDNLLRTGGIELTYDGTRLVGFNFNNDILGTMTAFSGPRASNWLLGHFLKNYFGVRANLRNAGEFFQAPFTSEFWKASDVPMTRAEVAEQLASQFGEDAGRATDQAIREADAAWMAVVRNPAQGGGISLRQQWGSRVTGTRQDFLEFLDDEIRILQDMGINDESIGAVQSLRDEIHGIGLTIETLTDPMAVADFIPRPLPRWMMERGIQSWLQTQRGLAAERSSVTRALEQWADWLDTNLRAGTIGIEQLVGDQAKILADLSVEAVDRKMIAALIAADGTKKANASIDTFETALTSRQPLRDTVTELDEVVMGVSSNRGLTNEFKGAVNVTQDNLLEYGVNYRFDNMIKFFSPFWMFQSRSPTFWIRSFAQHPEYLAWYSRYNRATRKNAIDNGATDSSGRPLNSKFGYILVPGSEMWLAPLNSISSRYVTPRPNPYPDEFSKDTSAMDRAIIQVYEYGSMFGFRPAPWITYPLRAIGTLDPNRVPIGSIMSHIDLVPPWIQRDIRRGLRMERYPNDPGLFSPDVGWQDYLIVNNMLAAALEEVTLNPDAWSKVQTELYDAMGYVPGELDEFGAPKSYSPIDDQNQPFRDNPRWIAARDRIEKGNWENQWVGFLTGMYPKEGTDAEAALLQNRDEFNFLADSINSITNSIVFDLDPVAESRHELFTERQFNTPAGFIDNLYGANRWTQLPDGGQAYGPERSDILASRIWENEVTQAMHDSMNLAKDAFDDCQKQRQIGDNPALKRACWAPFLSQLNRIDQHPLFDIARRGGSIGYKTSGEIQTFFENGWWRMVNATFPKYYFEDGEEYDNWQGRIVEWKEDLPLIAAELAATYAVKEIQPKTGDFETGEGQQIPGGRELIEEALLTKLIEQTNEEGWEAHKAANDTGFDVMNDAWEALRWAPWQEMIQGLEDVNSAEGELIQRAFMDKYGAAPEADELIRWVMENSEEGRFTPEQLRQVYEDQGAESIEHRLLPTTPSAVDNNEVWDKLSYLGPGENFKIFEEEYILAGGPTELLDAWYETGGHFADNEMTGELLRYISLAEAKLNIGVPSQAQLVEYGQAKRLNDDFRLGIENALGEDFYQILSIWGSLPKGANKDRVKEENEVVLEQYFDAREFYSKENQLWAKYYYPKFYKGGVGLRGEGVEGRPEFSAGTGNDGKRKSSFKPKSLSSRGIDPPPIVPMGYRSTYFVDELHNPNKLGSGGIGGQPYWPPGFGEGVPGGVLTEIVNLFEKDEPLSNPAIDFLKRRNVWAEYVKELLGFNGTAGRRSGSGGVKII